MPYVIALVTLEEGPRMMSNVVDSGVDGDTPAESIPRLLPAGLPLSIVFPEGGLDGDRGPVLPLFRPEARGARERRGSDG